MKIRFLQIAPGLYEVLNQVDRGTYHLIGHLVRYDKKKDKDPWGFEEYDREDETSEIVDSGLTLNEVKEIAIKYFNKAKV